MYVAAPPAFVVTLDGGEQVAETTMQLVLIDTRPEPAGWQLQLAVVTETDRWPQLGPGAGTLLVADVAATCVEPCTLPVSTIRGGAIPLAPAASPPGTFLNALPGSGSGAMIITPTLRLPIATSAYAGKYQLRVAAHVLPSP